MFKTKNTVQLLQQALKAESLYCPCCFNEDQLSKHSSIRIPTQHLPELPKNISLPIATHQCVKSPHPAIKNLIAVGSGKGGVGKSTLTYLIAHKLSEMGATVGILDADIYGPSQALLHQVSQKPHIKNGMIEPISSNGIQMMSIALISDPQKALSWRGPMIAKALMQMFIQTEWQDLDYLFVDLPPGTGDIPISLCQQLPTTAYISVTHQHPLSLSTTERFESLMTLMSIPKLLRVYNQSELSEAHHIPYQKHYQTLPPTQDHAITKLATCAALKISQLPIFTATNI